MYDASLSGPTSRNEILISVDPRPAVTANVTSGPAIRPFLPTRRPSEYHRSHSCAVALRDLGDSLDFKERLIVRQKFGDLHNRTRRRVLAEKARPNAIVDRKIAQVSKELSELDHIAE
jgi:hypothetical protein